MNYYELFEKYKNLKRTFNVITKVWVNVSNIVMPILHKCKEHQEMVVNEVQRLFTVFKKEYVYKLAHISPSAFHVRLNQMKIKCGVSPLELCFKRHPLQLAKNEIEKIKALFQNQDYQCWPASSIYYHALRKNKLFISLSTFYKYVNLLGLKRKWKKSELENSHPIVTKHPNEFIHIDTTFWSLTNGIKAAIILICDNFSKKIIGWNVSLRKDGENAKAALQKALETIRKHHPDLETTSLVTDGGGENHNLVVEDFLINLSSVINFDSEFILINEFGGDFLRNSVLFR